MSQVSDWYRCEQAMRRRRTARFIRPDGSASDTIRLIPRQTDVPDCQWIQYLHSVGLLRGSFRPPDVICAIRSLWRHRDSLIQMAAQHVMHRQKSLDQMNLQLHHVLNEITGLSGQRILDAILAGERDPIQLAELCHARVKSSQDTVARALEGDYRSEHLFDAANVRLVIVPG